MKRIRVPLFFLALLFLFSGSALAEQPLLRVTFFELGKADAILITTPAGEHILIDAGMSKDGKRLVERLEAEGIDMLDALILTHFDKDHIGGADRVLKALRVSQVVMPQYPKDGKQYEQLLKALQACAGAREISLLAGEQAALSLADGLALTVTAAHETHYGADEENDFSLAIRLRYGETRFLFPGDAEDARQRELLAEGDVRCDVLKMPHHGRYHDATPAFLREASPGIAFIPDSEEEPANAVVLELLRRMGTQVYRRGDGDLVVLSDGKTAWVEE